MYLLGKERGAIEVLILTNVFVFILTLAVGEMIFSKFALQPVSVFAKPWTLLTNMFIHVGLGHLVFNMIALFLFGIYLGRIVGENELLRVYFIGGLFASLSYVFTSLIFGIPDPRVFAVGASGAVFAIMGTLVVLRPNLTILFNFFIPMPLYVWAILYTLMALPAMFSPVGNIAHNAHLGGLLAGLLFGRHFKGRLLHRQQDDMYGFRFY